MRRLLFPLDPRRGAVAVGVYLLLILVTAKLVIALPYGGDVEPSSGAPAWTTLFTGVREVVVGQLLIFVAWALLLPAAVTLRRSGGWGAITVPVLSGVVGAALAVPLVRASPGSAVPICLVVALPTSLIASRDVSGRQSERRA